VAGPRSQMNWITIGSDPACQVCVSAPDVASKHARAALDRNGRLIVQDLGSGQPVGKNSPSAVFAAETVLPSDTIFLGSFALPAASVYARLQGTGTEPQYSQRRGDEGTGHGSADQSRPAESGSLRVATYAPPCPAPTGAEVAYHDLPEGISVIGSDSECAIRIEDRMVSPQHTVIVRRGNGYRIRDSGSLSGTFVDGVRIGQNLQGIQPGQVIGIGNFRIAIRHNAAHIAPRVETAPSVSRIPAMSQRAVALCPHCGNERDEAEDFCGFCGQSLRPPGVAPQVTQPMPTPAIASVPADVLVAKTPARIKESIVASPSPLPAEPVLLTNRPGRPWVRYWARFLDNFLGVTVFSLIAAALGFNVMTLNIYVLVLCGVLLWLCVEVVLLSSVGTTPGKWLFNTKVRRKDGAFLSVSVALRRACLVLVRGQGLGLPLIGLITLGCAYSRLAKDGFTSWDRDCGSMVLHDKLSPVKVILVVITFGVILFLRGSIASFAVWSRFLGLVP
jgi:uncharacterized RDD family membrane protein YckC